MIILVVIGCVALLGVIVYLAGQGALKHAHKRSEQMQALADATGLTHLDPFPAEATIWKQKRPPHGIDMKGTYPDFPLLKMASSQTYHVLEGEHKGRQVRLFELMFMVSTGKSTHAVIYGVASASVGKPVPLIDVRYQGLWQKVKELFGKADLQLDNPDFDNKYLIASANEHFARSVLDYHVQEAMLREPFDGHMLTGQSALVYAHGACTEEQFKAILERAHKLADRAAMSIA